MSTDLSESLADVHGVKGNVRKRATLCMCSMCCCTKKAAEGENYYAGML